jgi:hypothetical protein
MPEKFYPIILVASTGSKVRFKIIKDPVEYASFCFRFVKTTDTSLKEIKTLEALYLEKTATLMGYLK